MSQSGTTDKILRKAFEGIIAVLGPYGKEAIISEIRSRCDYNQEYLNTNEVMTILVRLFGYDSANLLLEQIRKVELRLDAKIAEMESRQSRLQNIPARKG